MNPPFAGRALTSTRGWRRVPMLGAVTALTVLTSGCSLWGWGFPTTVGDGGTAFRLAPVQIGTSTDWVAVSDSKANVCAIQTDGALWCWGENSQGELGDGTTVGQKRPVRVGSATWTSVSNGQEHVCAIQTDDSLWCWGPVPTARSAPARSTAGS